MKKIIIKPLFMNILALLFFISACGTSKSKFPTKITGEGSSFSLPFTDKLFRLYTDISGGEISLKSTDSYSSIEQLINNNVDFAVSEVYLTEEERQQHPDILHIPVAVAGVNFAYNIPQEGFTLYDDPVYLTEDIVAQILLGKITRWNHPDIVAVNKKVSVMPDRVFPNLPITVIRREGRSGETFLLTRFLNKASTLWKNSIGETNTLNTIGLGQSNALDIMKQTIATPGAFSYTTMIYGVQNNIPLIRVKNKLGTYVRGCNFRSTEAMKVASPSPDNRVDLTYPSTGPESAVAAGFIYILVKKEQSYNNRTIDQAQALINLLQWLLTPQAQQQLDPIFFAPLTPTFRKVAKDTIQQIVFNNEPIPPTTYKKKK